MARDGLQVLLLALGTRTDTEIGPDEPWRVDTMADTGTPAQFAGIGEYCADIVERRGVALPDQFEEFSEELRDKSGILIVADNGHMGASVDDAHLLGILQVLSEFTILTQKLEGFFLIL
jgi:hypothetical protein